MDIKIIPMQESDIEIIKDFVYQAFGKELGEPWSLKTSKEHCEEIFDSNYSFVAKSNNQILGAIFTYPSVFEKGKELFIDTLVVDGSRRGGGVGKKLIDYVFKLAKEKKFMGVRLMSNPKLRSFDWYHKLGFNESGWVELVKFF